jgi:hypothetical protein
VLRRSVETTVISGQTNPGQNSPLSAVTPKADKRGRSWIVRFVPIATNAPQQIASLFDHLVGAGKQHRRHGEAECLRGLEVDDHLELGRLLNRQITWLFALENLVNVGRCAAI